MVVERRDEEVEVLKLFSDSIDSTETSEEVFLHTTYKDFIKKMRGGDTLHL